MSTHPLVTILLPAFNSAHRIEKTIQSVIAQTFTNWELIVIDDCSADDTFATVKKIATNDTRIICLRNEYNQGIQKTLNRGLQESRGVYIARIDDDDQWGDIDKLQEQIVFLQNNADHVLVGTGAVVVDEKGIPVFTYVLPKDDSVIRKKILSKNCFIHSSVLFKKSAALLFNGYDESEDARYTQDYDLWLKLGTVGKFANLPRYAVLFTERSTGMSDGNRIRQAREALGKVKKFRADYPYSMKGYCWAFARVLFFSVQKIIPFKKIILHKIKKLYKQY